MTARIPRSEFLIPCGDWNGHAGGAGTEYREVHGGMGYDRSEPDVEGERILEYALAFDLLLGNTCFKKRDSHLRGDQIFFSATCPGQVTSKNPLVLKNFLLVPKYFSNPKSIGQIANTTISSSKCNSNQYMRGSVT